MPDTTSAAPKDASRLPRPPPLTTQAHPVALNASPTLPELSTKDGVPGDKWNNPAALAERLAELARMAENDALEYAAIKVSELITRAAPALLFTSVADLEGVEVEMPPVLIEGILREEEVMIFAGESKVGKTWLALQLAHAIATGTKWLGQQCAQGGVGYLNFEIDARVMNLRAKRISERQGEHPASLTLCHLRGSRADIPALTADIVAAAKAKGWKAIFIDALYNALGDRDENDNGAMAELMHELTKLAVETKCAVIVIHHFNKNAHANTSGNAPDGNQMSGAGALMRAPESIVTVTRIRADDATKYDLDDGMVNLRVAAALRTFAELEPFAISRNPKTADATRHDFSFREKDKAHRAAKAARQRDKEGRPPESPTIPELIAMMGDREFTPGELLKEGVAHFGVSKDTIKRRRAEAEAQGEIVAASKGRIRASICRRSDAVGSKGAEGAKV